MPKPSSCQDPH